MRIPAFLLLALTAAAVADLARSPLHIARRRDPPWAILPLCDVRQDPRCRPRPRTKDEGDRVRRLPRPREQHCGHEGPRRRVLLRQEPRKLRLLIAGTEPLCPARSRETDIPPARRLSHVPRSQRISYAKSTSHATIAQAEGPEAVYAIKLGLRDAEDSNKKSKMTVSAAQRKLADERREAKRGRDGGEEEEEEEEDEEDEDEGPQKKKSRQDGEDDDGQYQIPVVIPPCAATDGAQLVQTLWKSRTTSRTARLRRQSRHSDQPRRRRVPCRTRRSLRRACRHR